MTIRSRFARQLFSRSSDCGCTRPSPHLPIRIKNFGQIDERFYRGAKPPKKQYAALAGLGINTIIDLRENFDHKEKATVEALGMRYINIALSDSDYPSTASIEAFLKAANEPATGKFYVHCAGGRHRTGIVGAVYRCTVDNWNYNQAYAEMKAYGFYTRWGHSALKRFVQDYFDNSGTLV